MKLITTDLLDAVTEQAKQSERLRMNYNLHETLDAPIHRMLNALEPGTYLPPHRHLAKEETYLLLRGSLTTYFFDDAGRVIEEVLLDPLKGRYGLEIPAGVWHTIVAHESGTVIFEIKQGPYQPLGVNELAPWAPLPADKDNVAKFLQLLIGSRPTT